MSLKAFRASLQTYSANRVKTPAVTTPGEPGEPPKSSLRDQFAAFDHFLKPPLPSARLNNRAAPALPDAEHRVASGFRTKRSFSQDVWLQRCGEGGVAKAEDATNSNLEESEDRIVRKRRKVDDGRPVEPVVEDGGTGHDSEAGLFIQSEKEGPYEPLVLCSDGRVVQVPASINSHLLPHQRDGVKFLYNLYREDRGGILGDNMGLGKTIQTIALIAALLQRDCEVGALCSLRRLLESGSDRGSTVPPPKAFLILCPTSVLQNWEQEFQAWGSFRVGIYHGANRDAVLDKVHVHELEVLLTWHDMFRLNLTAL